MLFCLFFFTNIIINFSYGQKISQQDYRIIIDYCSEKIKEAPDYYYYYEGRADAKLALGKYIEAVDDYTMAIKRNKLCSTAFYDRGIAWFQINNMDSAKLDFIRAIKLKKNPEAYHYLGLIDETKKEYSQAIANYGKAIKDSITYADAYYNRGLCLSYIKDYQNAIENFKNVVKVKENINARINIAYNYSKLKKFDDAEREINLLLQKDTISNTIYRYKGLIAFEKNDTMKACEFFTKAKKLGAKNVDEDIKKCCNH